MVVGGWALTYFPFFIMGRVLYLHHYYPALFFAILNIGVLLDHVLGRRPVWQQRAAALLVAGTAAAVFVYFSPMCYGIEGPSRAFQGRRWLQSWNL